MGEPPTPTFFSGQGLDVYVSIRGVILDTLETSNIEKMAKTKGNRAAAKVKKVMREYKSGKLRSGSKRGKRVKSRKQAVAIAMSESRRGKKY